MVVNLLDDDKPLPINLAKLRSLAKGLTFSWVHLEPYYYTHKVKGPKGTSKICQVKKGETRKPSYKKNAGLVDFQGKRT